jgi:hypothetical protein
MGNEKVKNRVKKIVIPFDAEDCSAKEYLESGDFMYSVRDIIPGAVFNGSQMSSGALPKMYFSVKVRKEGDDPLSFSFLNLSGVCIVTFDDSFTDLNDMVITEDSEYVIITLIIIISNLI